MRDFTLGSCPRPELNQTNGAEGCERAEVNADSKRGLGARVGRVREVAPAIVLACQSSLTMRAQARGFSSRVKGMPDLYLIKQAEQGRETGAGQFGRGGR